MSRDKNVTNTNGDDGSGVKLRVRGWFHEMRKKSHVTVQKWVDSISLAVDEEDSKVLGAESEKQIKHDCDNIEFNTEEPSTSSGISTGGEFTKTGVKGKLTEICNKLNVNEKLKSKKVQDFKNLLAKTTHKIKDKNKVKVEMEQINQSHENHVKEEKQDEVSEEKIDEDINGSNTEIDRNKKCHLSTIGRSVSENPRPPPRTKRLTDIGRSFSVAHDNELPPSDSTDNLIYDAEEDDISLTNPSPNNTSPRNKIGNSQLEMNLRPPDRPLRMHTVSEGHYSPHVLPKNQLLRDCSFQSDESHCSSVESLLEQRKPDAEAILLNLGFGPSHGSDDVLTKIPKRFLKPSQVKGVDTETFLKNQQLAMNIHENSVLGYRGLLGNSHVPSDIVKAIMHRFSQNELRRMESMENISTQRSFKGVANTILAQRHFLK